MTPPTFLRLNALLNGASDETEPVIVGVASIATVRPGFRGGSRLLVTVGAYSTETIYVAESMDEVLALSAVTP